MRPWFSELRFESLWESYIVGGEMTNPGANAGCSESDLKAKKLVTVTDK